MTRESRGDAEQSGDEQRESEDETDDVPLDITGHEDRKANRQTGGETDAEPDGGIAALDGANTDIESRDGPGSDGEIGGTDADAEVDAGADTGENGTPETAAELIAESPADPEPNPEDEVEPVELLVQLAKSGEIEPWDIDIVAVTDKFLEALDEADLRTSGRALFYASVLLRMKSDVMLDVGDDEPEDEEIERAPWEAPPAEMTDDGRPAYDPVDALESEMDRRLERKHARGNPETLDELVRDLREAERGSWWKESRSYDTSDSPKGFRRGVQELDYHSGDEFRMDDEPTAEDALGNAHEEDIETTIADVQAVLADQYGGGRTEVLYEEIADAGGSRVETFLALLFLAHRGAVTLEQDDLFGDLWVCENADRQREAPATAD